MIGGAGVSSRNPCVFSHRPLPPANGGGSYHDGGSPPDRGECGVRNFLKRQERRGRYFTNGTPDGTTLLAYVEIEIHKPT
jgi:hypothetical protein